MASVLLLIIALQLFVAFSENKCQNLDNCPYNYENTMPDYVPGDPIEISTASINWMRSTLEIYLNATVAARPPSEIDDVTVFTGTGGRALMFLRLYDRSKDAEYLDMANQYIATSLANVGRIQEDIVGFLWGRTGVYSVAAVLASLRGNETEAQSYIAEVQSIFDRSVSDSYAKWDDFDAGRAGLLYAASFLGAHFGTDVIQRESIVAVAEATIARGKALSSDPDSYLQWLSPNDGGKWLGQSHGQAGVLTSLLDVPEVMAAGTESRRLVEGTLDYIVAHQFESGNFPSEYYAEDEDQLVQWDHGAPGVMGCLAKAAGVLGEQGSKYADSARKAADCTWKRGLLYKGLMLCHGITGNTYMQLYMYNALGDSTYLYRALQFQEFVRGTPDLWDIELMRKPTPNPFGFYGGSYEGAIMLWVDLIAASGSSSSNSSAWSALAMPGYQPAL